MSDLLEKLSAVVLVRDMNSEEPDGMHSGLFDSIEEEENVKHEMEENPNLKRKVLWKIDLVIITNLFLISFIEFLDKVSLSYAAVFGLSSDTHLMGSQYSTLSSIFYFGYLLGQAISFYLLPKVKIGKYVAANLGLWGAVLMCFSACNSFGGLAAVRFILGIFEACILPSFMIITSIWWNKDEQPLRSVLYYNTLAGILGGIFAHYIGKLDTPLEQWRLLFLIYGAATVGYSFMLFFVMPDKVETAWFLNRKEKQVAYLRVLDNQTGSALTQKFNKDHIIESLKDPKYYVLVGFLVCQAVCSAGISNFNTLIIEGFGYSKMKTTLMATPQAAVALGAGIISSLICYYVKNVRCLMWFLSCLPALAGSIMVNKIDSSKYRNAALAGAYMMGFYNVPFCMVLGLNSSNNAGTTKKTFMSISVAVWYAVGNIIGPQFFKSSQKPKYPMGIHAMEACFTIMAATAILYYVFVRLENRKRSFTNDDDIMYDEKVRIDDISDGQNKAFIYVY